MNSTPEFQDLYLQAANARKQLQKAIEPPTRSHIGCIVHIVSPQTEKSNTQLVGKINFIDLASMVFHLKFEFYTISRFLSSMFVAYFINWMSYGCFDSIRLRRF